MKNPFKLTHRLTSQSKIPLRNRVSGKPQQREKSLHQTLAAPKGSRACSLLCSGAQGLPPSSSNGAFRCWPARQGAWPHTGLIFSDPRSLGRSTASPHLHGLNSVGHTQAEGSTLRCPHWVFQISKYPVYGIHYKLLADRKSGQFIF